MRKIFGPGAPFRRIAAILQIPAFVVPAFLAITLKAQSPASKGVLLIDVGPGWAANSVNTVIFRKNSLVTARDTQFISYYDQAGYVILGKRHVASRTWQLKKTSFQGRVRDAHNSISIMVDRDGYLHLAWDHHNNRLNYSRSMAPFSLEMGEKTAMTGNDENSVSYPEFYATPRGDLLFLYRDGGSGRGNLVINRYDPEKRSWTRLHGNLIDGEGKRNAYWQATVDDQGIIHISWVWRESPDVASNHDLCYARSSDGGHTWEKSNGENYELPITASSAEYIARIPEKSELINQTSMCSDADGQPVVAGYWREQGSSVPQFHLAYRRGGAWQVKNLLFRKTPFSLSGAGTKQIPISRPQVIAWKNGKKQCLAIIFRDAERGNRVSVAVNRNFPLKRRWKLFDLTTESLGAWEPTFDTESWRLQKKLQLFLQNVSQPDAEGVSTDTDPRMVQVLEWEP